MILLVDIGNSRIKWACQGQDGLTGYGASAVCENDLPGFFNKIRQQLPSPDHILVSNVAGRYIKTTLDEFALSCWSITPVYVHTEKQWRGVINAYTETQQMGVDRWLAIIAAWSHYQGPVCVVDCGTAVTVDVVINNGKHLGGLIIPGTDMMQEELTRNTDGISITNKLFSLQLGKSTVDCISNGAGYAVVAFIDRILADMKNQYGMEMNYIITGGAAEKICKHLTEKVDFDPYLVLKGLSLVRDDYI